MATITRTSLIGKVCPKCGHSFKVIDAFNYCCPSCYTHEIPKYKHKKGTGNNDPFLEFADPERVKALIEMFGGMVENRSESERQYCTRLCKVLEEDGVPYIQEHSCGAGRIDIFIKTTPEQIVEVKTRPDPHLMMAALGQLLFYKESYPKAQLYVKTPYPIGREYRSIFKKYGIEEWFY